MSSSSSVLRHQVFDLTFHGVEYLVTLAVDDNGSVVDDENDDEGGGGGEADAVLRMGIEQKNNNNRWKGSFPASYVEGISMKTGNFKKFGVFVEMLRTALANDSDTVFVDLLTFADLEMLKTRHHTTTAAAASAGSGLIGGGTRTSKMSSPSAGITSQKRYLILTYAVEFDRVHYPLPFQFDSSPSPQALQRTIARLRRSLTDERQRNEEAVGGTGDLVAENRALRRQLRDYAASVAAGDVAIATAASSGSGGVGVGVGDSVPVADYALLQQRYDQLRLEAQQKLKMARNERDALLREIDALQGDDAVGSLRADLATAQTAAADAKRKHAALLSRFKATQTCLLYTSPSPRDRG